MAKLRTSFVCSSCEHRFAKWLGRCSECGEWNSLEEVQASPTRSDRPAWGAGDGKGEPVALSAVEASPDARLATGIGELDRVLGGGVVPGSLVLVGGDPGIGKSTLLLSVADRLSKEKSALYVTGEESLRQTRMRSDRLGIQGDRLLLLAETDASRVLEVAERTRPSVLVVDSIQTLFLPELGSAPGSLSQVREVAGRLMAFAKRTQVPTFLVGHVTKEGSIAGPRVLEHMVDTVLYFEGERGQPYRLLRSHKNRFGSTNEIGVFEMKGTGLAEVTDPSSLFLAERSEGQAGSVVTSTLGGSRPLLIEVQALAAPTGYGTARRTSIGVDSNRVALLAAVLERKAGLPLVGCDLFVNVTGGIQVSETASDLAICAALASSQRNVAIDAKTLVLGEIGLAGEVRAMPQPDTRLMEAEKMGFERAVMPASTVRRVERCGLELVGVRTLSEALERLL